MRENLTKTIEDYLKAIYELSRDEQRASTNQIADCMGITPASVSEMVKKLAETQPPLVEYQKHRGVTLTVEGERIALEIVRHHRLLELFLYQILGYSWDEVHAEADRLEHVISEEFEERISAALGDPLHDPHGEPIPTRDLRMPEEADFPLADMRQGTRVEICRVRSSDAQLLRYLSERGLVPGARLAVQEHSPFDGNLLLQVEDQGTPFVLGPRITQMIFVRPLLPDAQA